MMRMWSTMPRMMEERPARSRVLWLDRGLKRVEMRANVPIIIRNRPVYGVNFFIKTLNLVQRYKIMHNS